MSLCAATTSQSLDDIITNAFNSNENIIFVSAAGNSDQDACSISPASTEDVVTVASIDRDGSRSSFSNWGSCLDLLAPGNNIKSSSNEGNRNYEKRSGTSMAAPHVAGALALDWGNKPSRSAKTVIERLLDKCTVMGNVRENKGTPNLVLSIASLLTTNTTTDRNNATLPTCSSAGEACTRRRDCCNKADGAKCREDKCTPIA